MRFATDDAARRQEFIWLGPVNSPAPFEARGQAWIAGLLILPVAMVLAFLVIPGFVFTAAGLPGPLAVLAHVVLAAALGCAGGVLLIRAAGRRIQPVTPLRHHTAMLQAELAVPRPEAAQTYQVSISPALFLEDRPEHRTTYRVRAHRHLT